MFAKKACQTGAALAASLLSLALLAPAPAAADTFPDHPIRFIVAYGAGGPTDIWSRLLGKRLSDSFKVPVIVDNKPGAGGVIGTAEVAKAQPDGYTISFGGVVFFGPIFHAETLSYDVRKDFALLGGLYKTGFVLGVPSSLPVNTLPEFIAYVKSHPGKTNYAAGTNSGEMMMEILKTQTGMDILAVRYKGNADALTALLSGQVQAGYDQLGPFKPQAASGKLKLLAVTTDARMESLPNVPTLAESGFPKATVVTRSYVFTRSGVPSDVAAKYNAAIRDAVTKPEFIDRARLEDATLYAPTIADLKNYNEEDIAFWTEAARVANYKP